MEEKDIDQVEAAIIAKSTIVDAREIKAGEDIIKGAVVLSANASDAEIHKALPKKDPEIITYCGSPSCPASTTLAYRLVELGYKNVFHYAGGIKEWTEAGKPTDKAKAKPAPEKAHAHSHKAAANKDTHKTDEKKSDKPAPAAQ